MSGVEGAVVEGAQVWWADQRGFTHVGRVVEVRGNRVTVQVGPTRKHKHLADVRVWEPRGR